MSIYHITNGNCLAQQLRQTDIHGNIIICRECLIEGNRTGDSLAEFWTARARYISEHYQSTTAQYFNETVAEFEKIIQLPEQYEVHLWFEDDLFCQTNMWFILALLMKQETKGKIYRVFPTVQNSIDHWKGFGPSDTEMLKQSLSKRVACTRQDVELGAALWTAYRNDDFKALSALSRAHSSAFQYLKEVCQAHIDRFPIDGSEGRPEKTVKELLVSFSQDFQTLFNEFSKRQGIYGFGDAQVKAMYDRLLNQ